VGREPVAKLVRVGRGSMTPFAKSTRPKRVLFCTVNRTLQSMVLCMEKLADSICVQVATMSHEEIVWQFKKVFGREMTSFERNCFFLPNQEAPPPGSPA
jgi:hypothetical protein